MILRPAYAVPRRRTATRLQYTPVPVGVPSSAARTSEYRVLGSIPAADSDSTVGGHGKMAVALIT